MKPSIFSTPAQLKEIAAALCCYMRLPLSPKTIPGAYLEALIAEVHQGEVLDTYDFVDVIHRKRRIGWQVKSTMGKLFATKCRVISRSWTIPFALSK